ncbi:Facilitated trehalose transporter Tret1 [Frankliniella fusca]|uniref:Facilitated trehalose transporter Tret1 n=1 Tax=Frankliniella fusca TaxID=407009 RepID=A0AAE1HDN7_9NEOP|nr:Facilitated trehalose transporter Tret1 [Frankliniella fusca]
MVKIPARLGWLTKHSSELLVAMAASLGYMTIGLVRGWSSPGLPSMLDLDPELVPNDEIVSWVSAVPPLGAMIGSLAVAPALQHLGRKRSLLLAAPVFVAGWLLIAFATSSAMLICARVLCGFCAGLVIPCAQVYVSESAHAKTRGMLGSLPALFMAGGVLISYVLGTWLTWRSLALASAAFPALLFLCLLPLPESPAWLLSHGRVDDAKASLRWLKRSADVAAVELNVVQRADGGVAPSSRAAGPGERERRLSELTERSPRAPRSPGAAALSTDEELDKHADREIADIAADERRRSIVMKGPTAGDLSFKAFLRRPVLLPFGLCLALLGFQQVSGIDTVIFYTVEIFMASGGSINEYLATILIGVVQLVCTMLSVLVIDKTGRRPLLLVSGATTALAMALVGAYFHLHERGRADGLGLLPVASLVLFMVGFSVGYANIPFLLMGELLPVRQRSVLSSLAGSFNLGTMFLVIKTYPQLRRALGTDGAFWLYAALCLASCLFVALLLPETKGKTLDEIECYFEGKHQRAKEKRKAKLAAAAESVSTKV